MGKYSLLLIYRIISPLARVAVDVKYRKLIELSSILLMSV